MLYDNDGRDLDYVALESDFFVLTPTDELARKYSISEEQVLDLINIHATVQTTTGREYKFYFGGDAGARVLTPDNALYEVLGVESWKPKLLVRVAQRNHMGYGYLGANNVRGVVWSSGD